ncbi:MAG: DUF2934 domain-containing protein [Dongiaceae bacterium]|jgi:hypothetical protein
MISANIYDRIRERAYSLWEREGRPHGRQMEHWLRAESEITGTVGRPKAAKTATPIKAARRAPRRK